MINQDALFFFDQNPAALHLFEAFEGRLQQKVGEFSVRVQKTQITYSNRYVFACVSFLKVRKARQRPPVYIVVTFGLDHPLESPRIDAAVEVSPHRWTHHVLVSDVKEIDEELLNWVQQAYQFSAEK